MPRLRRSTRIAARTLDTSVAGPHPPSNLLGRKHVTCFSLPQYMRSTQTSLRRLKQIEHVGACRNHVPQRQCSICKLEQIPTWPAQASSCNPSYARRALREKHEGSVPHHVLQGNAMGSFSRPGLRIVFQGHTQAVIQFPN